MPSKEELDENKTYMWCACGQSSFQPFCDGSHSGTDKYALKFKPEKTGTYHLCTCKKTQNPPYCDNSHNK